MVKFKFEFDKCNVKVIVLLVDGVEVYNQWIKDIEEIQQIVVGFFIVVDVDKKVVGLYDMIYLNQFEMVIVCLFFVIDLKKKVCFIIIYLMSIGCNFDEVLCVIDVL